MDKNSKILIIGGYGGVNWGDDAQLYNNIRLLKEKGYINLLIMTDKPYIGKLCNCQITPSFRDTFARNYRKDTKKMMARVELLYKVSLNYDKKKILLSNLEKTLLDSIRNTDVLFFSGSGTINTRHMFGILRVLTPCLIAENFGKKVVLSGQGVTPMENTEMEKYISNILNKVDVIVLRDFQLGKKELERIKVDPKKVVLGIDDAFTTPVEDTGKIKIPKNAIGINISKSIKPEMYETFYLLSKKLQKEGYNVVFNYFHPKDKEEVMKCSKGEFPIVSFEKSTEIAYFYANVIASIGMRYHSAILGLGGDSPVINIYTNKYQHLKLKAIEDAEGIKDFTIDYQKITVDILFKMLQRAMKSQPDTISRIKKEWTKKEGLAIKFMESL